MDEEPNGVELDDSTHTAFVGRFDPLEVPIIIEALTEHGIFATTKAALENDSTNVYPFLDDGRGTLLVDRARLDDARRIIAEEVPQRIAALRAGLEEGGEPDVDREDFAPLGWLEPDVARVLLEHLADVGIEAAPEYPLDAPPPPYARADGRVRVHVEEILLEEAEDVLSSDVRDALVARGIAFTEPLIGDDA
ncbi:MAG: hypothetical protein ACRDKS_13540 [Actinomycetota bacterium]